MLIQSATSMTQAPQPARISNNRPPSDGVPEVVATPSNIEPAPSVAVDQPQVAKQQISPEHLQNVVDSINKAMSQTNSNLEFSVDADTKKQVVKLVDKNTGDVIRQFPSDEMLAISRSIDRIQQGLLLKQKA